MYRYKADVIIDAFIAELNNYNLDAIMKELRPTVLLDVYNNDANESIDDKKTVLKQIDEQNESYLRRVNLRLLRKLNRKIMP